MGRDRAGGDPEAARRTARRRAVPASGGMWRPAPLLVLVALGAAAAYVESLPLGAKTSAVRELRMTVAGAKVDLGSAGTRASFAADSLDIGPRIGSARAAAGVMEQDGAPRSFSAGKVSNDLFTSSIELSEGVRIWQDGEDIDTSWATLGRDGSLSGAAVTVSGEGYSATADAFRTDADGNLILEGNVWTAIDN